MAKAARYIAGGIVLCIIGVMMSIGWYYAHGTLEGKVLTTRLKDSLVIQSLDSEGYYDWSEGNALNNPNYYVYYLWNITNPIDVLAGSTPIYEQVGPYYYRYIWYNRNATFPDDGNVIQYNLVEDYIFVSNMSASDPTEDMITTLNPGYVTILDSVGGDSNFYTVATLPFISTFVEFMTTEFLDVVSSQYTPEILGNVTQEIITFLSGLNPPEPAQQYFYSFWANGTALPVEVVNWLNCFPNMNSTSPIPTSTVARLFSNESLSLIDSSTKAVMYWLRASINESGSEASEIVNTFSLSASQLHAIVQWRNSTFIPAYVRPVLLAEAQLNYALAVWEDVGWVQFITGYYTAPNSFSDVYSSYYPQFNAPFEIGGALPGIFTVPQAKTFLVGPYGVLLNINNFGLFDAAATPTGDLSPWGIDYIQATAFEFYMNDMSTPYSEPVVKSLINGGETGLIMTKSADFWLWRCVDPLVALIAGPENAYCGLQTNDTVQPPSQIYSGKRNLAEIGQYITWHGSSTVDFWNGTVNVYGWTDGGQFSPYLKENQTLYIWDESFVKTLEFNSAGHVQLYGIDVVKYVLNQSAFAVSQLYTNTIEGFANVTLPNQGAPIFLSNFDFYGVSDAKYTNFSGLQPNSSDIITIYVEPITGSTLLADEKLQINLYYPPEASGWNTVFKQFSKIKPDIVYPLLKAWQKSTVSESQANKLRGQLKYFRHSSFNTGLLWGIVGFGIFLVIVSMVLIAKGIKARNRNEYEPINR